MKTKFTLTAILCLLLSAKIAAAIVIDYGTCGPKLTWELTDDGTLTISGEGEMDSWYNENDIPWDLPRNDIKTVVIESGVTSIGSSAFSGCISLTSIKIPKSVTYIGSYAFQNCSSLTSVTIAEGVTSIENSVFEGCSSLTSITIPESVTSIGSYAFKGCSSLTSITIPESVTSIGSYAFESCDSLTSVTIPKSVTSIQERAFYTNSRGKEINIYYLGDLKSWCEINFGGIWTHLTNLYIQGKLLTDLTITEDVTKIGKYAFKGCNSLTSVMIPKNVTEICDYAFSVCGSLKSATIQESATRMGHSVFENCRNLTSITLPKGVTKIGNNTFSGCSSLTSITLPESIRWIGDDAFSGCSNLTSITLPESIRWIGDDAFSGCDSLTSITIPKSVTKIGAGAFDTYSRGKEINIYYLGDLRSWCEINFGGIWTNSADLYIQRKLLTDLTIPDSITSIGNYTFSGCKSLISVTIPTSVTSIGGYAFKGCKNLKSITIPTSVTYIGSDTFEGCSSLTSITIPESVTYIGRYAFKGCSSLTSITIPESVISIGLDAFRGCNSLKSVVLPGTQLPGIGPWGWAGAFDCTTPLFTNADTIPERVNNYYNITHLRNAIKIKHVYNGEKAKLTLTHSIPGYRVTPEWGDIDLKIDAGEYEMGEFKLWFTIEGHNDSVSALCRWPNYTYTIEQAEQEISWIQDLSEMMEVGCEIELKATASSGLDVKFTSNDESVVAIEKIGDVTKLKCLAEGEAVITAKQNGNKNYKAAPAVEKTCIIKREEQEISWTQDLSEAMEVGCEIELKATASSGLDVKFTSNDESVVSVNKRAGVTTLTCMSGGEAIITAKQNGNKNYKAAPVVEKTIRVKTTTGLPTIESGITVVSNPGEIVVEGATAEEPLTVYDMQGHKVYSGQEKSIEVSGGKIYIVKIGGRHYKVFVP